MSLVIETERWHFTLEGDRKASVWASRIPARDPQLRVSASGGGTITALAVDGQDRPVSGVSYVGGGPSLFEETRYRLTVASRTGGRPRLLHLDPSLIRSVTPIPGHPDVVSGTINFHAQVGLTRFLVQDDESSLEITVEVRPSKLDYQDDYDRLLEGVAGLTRQLVLEFLRATTREIGVEGADGQRTVEWLVLLRSEIRGLELALNYIVSEPHRQLVREPQFIPAERIRRPSAETRRAAIRGSGQGEWITSPAIGRLRSKLPASVPQETTDNPENRWLRQQLDLATRSLAQVRQDFFQAAHSRGRRPSTRALAIVSELEQMEETLAPFLSLAPFVDVSQSTLGDISSLTLQGRPGYREAYQSLLRLRMSLLLGGSALETPLRDISDLYEIWCFLAVLERLSAVLGTPVDIHDLVELSDNGVNLRLVAGATSAVTVEAPDCVVRVSYNREYKALSGAQRPDIVIEVFRPDLAPLVLIMDAKYRLDTTPEYVRTFGCPGPPADAVGQLHRYRDAIVVKYAGYPKGRPVVRAVALFPLSEADSDDWLDHQYFASIDAMGVGAIPFLPTNMTWVDEWLRHALQAPAAVLAWPGPDFIAWSELTR